ncbi:hypothetical protein [Salinispora arenicola]|uniref:hypothetical protein n=1 Tax=Salinispora arenicola TaxID=168697 RepID=UPI0027DB7571|nr:hypothetical protein [Salinispora arenicola]
MADEKTLSEDLLDEQVYSALSRQVDHGGLVGLVGSAEQVVTGGDQIWLAAVEQVQESSCLLPAGTALVRPLRGEFMGSANRDGADQPLAFELVHLCDRLGEVLVF